MHLLAEANRNVPGRWVLVPPKGRPLDGGQAARRARARRRRRLIFMLLGDGALLSGVMGAFPGLRSMLYGTAALSACLVLYSGFLLLVSRRERAAIRRRRVRELQTTNGHRQAAASGNGHAVNGNVLAANGNGHGHNGNGHDGVRNGDSHEVRVIARRAATSRRASFASPG